MQYQTGDGHRRKQRRVLIAHELDTPEDHPERKRLLPSHKFEFAVGHLFGNMFRSCEVPFLLRVIVSYLLPIGGFRCASRRAQLKDNDQGGPLPL